MSSEDKIVHRSSFSEVRIPRAMDSQVQRLSWTSRRLVFLGQLAWIIFCASAVCAIYMAISHPQSTVRSDLSEIIIAISSGLLVLSVIVAVVRDSLIARGNDIFQIVSDTLENRSHSSEFLVEDEDLQIDDSIRYTKGDIRIVMRSFVTSSQLPLLRSSNAADLLLITVNIVLFSSTVVSSGLLFDGFVV